MHVRDPLAVSAERLDRVAAADEVVPDVEAEGEDLAGDRCREARDLVGCLDIGAGVGVERDAGAGDARLP